MKGMRRRREKDGWVEDREGWIWREVRNKERREKGNKAMKENSDRDRGGEKATEAEMKVRRRRMDAQRGVV